MNNVQDADGYGGYIQLAAESIFANEMKNYESNNL